MLQQNNFFKCSELNVVNIKIIDNKPIYNPTRISVTKIIDAIITDSPIVATISLASLFEIKNLITKNNTYNKKKFDKTTKSPSAASKDAEEKRLGTALTELRRNLIKPFEHYPQY